MKPPRPKSSAASDADADPSEGTAAPKKPRAARAPRDAQMPWAVGWRVAATLALGWHLVGVAIAPWRLSTPDPPPLGSEEPLGRRGAAGTEAQGGAPAEGGEAPLIGPLYRFMLPYLNLVFINHGYEFFAPDPSATKLLRYQAYDAENREVARDVFPDRKTQWPRLFYHRHMMLAEQAAALGPEALRMYGRRLLRKHQASRVHLDYGVHYLLAPQDVLQGTSLNDSSTYATLDSIDVTASAESLPRVNSQVRIPGVSP